MGDERDDPDREAILARRRRFVAIALSGLTSVAACGEPQPPQVCLSPIPAHEPVQVEPLPCLTPVQVLPPERADPHPTPCLDVPASEIVEPDDEEQEPGELPSSQPAVCLGISPPRPCLDVETPPRDRE